MPVLALRNAKAYDSSNEIGKLNNGETVQVIDSSDPSYYNIEGITSPDGRVFGKMAHSERRDDGVAINIYGQQDLKIFESGVEYFK